MTLIRDLSTIICSRSSFCYFQYVSLFSYEITIAFPMSGKYLSAYEKDYTSEIIKIARHSVKPIQKDVQHVQKDVQHV